MQEEKKERDKTMIEYELSPLINHKSTQKGTVRGGFDRVNLLQQAEQGFDKLLSHPQKIIECSYFTCLNL